MWHSVSPGPASCRVTLRPGAHAQELPKLVLRVPRRMEPLLPRPTESSSLRHAHGRTGQPGCHCGRVEMTRRDSG